MYLMSTLSTLQYFNKEELEKLKDIIDYDRCPSIKKIEVLKKCIQKREKLILETEFCYYC